MSEVKYLIEKLAEFANKLFDNKSSLQVELNRHRQMCSQTTFVCTLSVDTQQTQTSTNFQTVDTQQTQTFKYFTTGLLIVAKIKEGPTCKQKEIVDSDF